MTGTLVNSAIPIRSRLTTDKVPHVILAVGEDRFNWIMNGHSAQTNMYWLEADSTCRAEIMMQLYGPECVVVHENRIGATATLVPFMQVCTQHQTPVVILTADQTPYRDNEWDSWGAFACLPKLSLTATVLQATIADAVTKTLRLPSLPPPTRCQSAYASHIQSPAAQTCVPDLLIVEDDVFLVAALKRRLKPKGYKIRSADTVEGAIGQVKKSLPDLILLDVKLSGEEGWWLAEWLQMSTETIDIPIIVLSGLLPAEIAGQAHAYGVFTCLTKPVTTECLVNTITDALQL